MMQRKVIWLLLGLLAQYAVVSSLNTTIHTKSTVSESKYNTTNVTRIFPTVTIGHILKNLSLSLENQTDARRNATHSQNSSYSARYLCNLKQQNVTFYTNDSCYSPSAPLQCFHDPIFCKKHFTSGKRELQNERPTYGEYSSLRHQRWFHVIQHGGIAFLFHPCTAKKEIRKLREVASECLHRYVLAPYPKLTQTMPVALVSWGCFLISTQVDTSQMRSWIRKHAYGGPASHVHTNGKFKNNLVKKSEVITNVKDDILCPNKQEKKLFTSGTQPTVKKVTFNRNPESIINNRVIKLNNLKPGIEISANITVTKVETGSAVWAAASLIFLCGILVGWLLYTRQWSHSKGEYKYNPLSNKDSFECEPGQSQFNLLKSSQKFMSTFRYKEQPGKKEDGMSKVNLMVPINEEGDDEDDIIFQR